MLSRTPENARGSPTGSPPFIRRLATDDEARECAELMSSSDPWRRLRRDFDQSYRMLLDSAREVYVAVDVSIASAMHIAGFVIVVMHGAFVGYIQTVAVREDSRGRGLGTPLIDFAERRIFGEQPNVFICVSSFNPDARRLYERLGYQLVGELTDYFMTTDDGRRTTDDGRRTTGDGRRGTDDGGHGRH